MAKEQSNEGEGRKNTKVLKDWRTLNSQKKQLWKLGYVATKLNNYSQSVMYIEHNRLYAGRSPLKRMANGWLHQ